jgi:hypothetical protein
MSGTNYLLWCILGFEGDNEEPFTVRASSTTIFDHLKEEINQKLKHAIAAKNLSLWKVRFSDYS